MKHTVLFLLAGLALFVASPHFTQAQSSGGASNPSLPQGSWRFAVSGDSRNCGDVVMPAIAANVKQARPRFYWHLGDFRKISGIDEDIQHDSEYVANPLSIDAYENIAWDNFVEKQLMPFGSLPVYLSIGNHETTKPKTRDEYLVRFRQWLDVPKLRAQRLRDDPAALDPKAYYHWIEGNVDFLVLDNATPDQFDAAQLSWFEKRLDSDAANPRIRTLVVGMHEALPESISADHAMDQSPAGIESGRRVYADLLKTQNGNHKRVYVLASHSHYYMDGIFNTDYWRTHGGVLPGWIIGTAGAQRYALPAAKTDARAAETNVYGFELATVGRTGEIQFEFKRLEEPDIPASVLSRYTPAFVHWCFAENRTGGAPPPH